MHLHRTIQRITELPAPRWGCYRSGDVVGVGTRDCAVCGHDLGDEREPRLWLAAFYRETSTSKLRRMRKVLDDLDPCDLQVDGGVDVHNIDDVVRSGANVIVVGSAVFNARNTPGASASAAQGGFWGDVADKYRPRFRKDTMMTSDVSPVTQATLKSFLEAFNHHNLDAIMEYFADDCVLYLPRGSSPAGGTQFEGKAEVRKGLATRFEGLPDVHYGDNESLGLRRPGRL